MESSLNFLEENKILITGSGLSVLMCLSAYATCSSILHASIHAIPLGRKKHVITNAYVAVIMASTIFVYSLILATLIIKKIDIGMDPILSLKYFASSVIFGIGSYFCGLSFSEVCRRSYGVLDKNPDYYVIFLCGLSAAELVTLFSFLVSLFIVL